MWIPARLTVPPGRMTCSATGTSSPAGANTTARSQGAGRQLRRVADPRGAQLPGERPVPLAPGEHDRLAAPVREDLEREVRRRAEPEERDAVAGLHLGAPQRAVADHAGARAAARRRGPTAWAGSCTAKSSGTVIASA